jgi:hypothetical protein
MMASLDERDSLSVAEMGTDFKDCHINSDATERYAELSDYRLVTAGLARRSVLRVDRRCR